MRAIPLFALAAAAVLLAGLAHAQDGQVVISEVVAKNKNSFKDDKGNNPDWLEIYNYGSSSVDLGGYKLTDDKSADDAWTFPSGTTLGGGQYLVVAADGTGESSGKYLHTDFKISADDNFVALLSPSGDIVSEVFYPALEDDQSFGLKSTSGRVAAQSSSSTGPAAYALLSRATPGKENAGPKGGVGPTVVRTLRNPKPRPSGGDITVSAVVVEQSDPVQNVELVYVVGYGSETTTTMSSTSNGTYTATIPSSVATPGAMVRWYIKASDSGGRETRDPPYKETTDRQYYGTVVEDTTDSSSLPVVDLYCKDDKAPYNTDKNTAPGCSLLFDGDFYDNVAVRRRGVSSMNWPKPKFKVDAGKQGKIFKLKKGAPKVKEFNMNSEWFEPGENTFMRETLAWQAFREMGVDALNYFQTQVRLNGKYYGKFSLGEDWEKDQLREAGYSVDPNVGPFFKSESGEFSNLRWDIPPDQVMYYYGDISKTGKTGDLVELGKGLAGGGAEPRSEYLFDMINLPKTINHMAAQTLVLNQDRCTKNFYVYLDPSSQQWSMLPWDIESAFSIDRGLGGGPAADYCILACEQWNSPLYCDKNHPQDLAVSTPWGLITTQINPRTPAGGRKLTQSSSNGSGTTAGTASNGAAEPGLSLPSTSSIASDYDADQTKKGPTVTGAPGTFNYLVDAILAVPRTRAMYMRRLRTLMDQFISSGRLQALVTAEYEKIKDEAARDVAKWGHPGSPEKGYQQLITEQLPIRKDQLYNKYGPGSDTPLIPDAQPSSVSLSIGDVASGSSGYVQVVNNNDIAVDVSGWKLSGNGVEFTFIPGTVIPAKDSVYVAATSISTFKNRGSSPNKGSGAFVVGPLTGTPSGAGGISISAP